LPYPPEEEIQWLLKECEKYLSKDLKVRRSDVLSAWRGWRPLAADPNAPPGGQVSRDHVVSKNPKSGVTFIAGGKWTTWREMAEDVLDKVLGDGHPKCNTLDIMLHGGEGYSESLPIQLIQKYGLMDDVAEHLARTYGGRAWEVVEMCQPTGKKWPRYGVPLAANYPYIEAEVRFACKEYACTIEDILSRRTRLAFLNSEAAIEALHRVADIMAEELGWSKKIKAKQVEAAKVYLDAYGGRIPVEDDIRLRLPTLQETVDIFNEVDRDGSGFLDLQEVKEMADRLGQSLSANEVQYIFEAMDTDSDGKVTPEEFAKWLSSQETMEGLKTYFHNKSLQIFSDIDTDKSGYIDKKELKDISERLGQKDLDTEKVFKEMDMDSDGKVSKEEFIAWMDTHDGTGFHKMLTSKMGLGGTGWLEQKDSSFLG